MAIETCIISMKTAIIVVYGAIFWLGSATIGEQLQFPDCDEIFRETDSFALCTRPRIRQECAGHCSGGQKISAPKYSASSRGAAAAANNVAPVKVPANKIQQSNKQVTNDKECDGISPCISLQSANDRFYQCCKKKGIADKCLFLCDYTRSGSDLQDAVIDGLCPVSLLENYLKCASNEQDNTPCCKETGILNPRRKTCPSFCNTALMTKWPKSLGQAVDYLPCVEVQDKILKCHWAGLRDGISTSASKDLAPSNKRIGGGSAASSIQKNQKSKTSSGTCDGITPCVSLASANARFAKCCKSRGIIDRCLFLCDYTKGSDDLQDAVIDGVCPVSLLENYLKCASNEQDNNKCCEKTGVINPRRKICTAFCNPTSLQKWPKGLGQAVDYLPCVQLQDKVLKCHWASLRD